MTLITWNHTLSTKVKLFDDQHIKLIDMINDLHGALIDGKGSEHLDATLEGLLRYTNTHFAEEEELMFLYAYPEADTHKSEHEKLFMQVLELENRLVAGQSIKTHDVLMFLRDWLVNHIQGVDKRYGLFLNAHGVS